ncbi:MAG: hypothetical protein II001_04660, partial [Bacteroidales bacterium]|nr:hypothetical protein [Bacteroidales bacterium]
MYMNEDLFVDFLSVREILWVGVNFSKAKFTRAGFDYSQEIMQHYFQEWNKLILNDQKKYDIRMSFRKPMMHYDLSAVTKLNKSVKISNFAGKLGYKWANLLVREWFGLGSLALVLILFAVSARLLLQRWHYSMTRTILLTVSGALVAS